MARRPWAPGFPVDERAASRIPGAAGRSSDYGPGAPPVAPVFDVGRTSVAFPPDYFPPPGAQEFFKSVDFSSPVAGVSTPAGLVLQLPQGMSGIIRSVGYGVEPMTTATVVSWQVLINGAAVQGWTRTVFARNLPSVNVGDDAYIRLPDGAQVSIVFTNTDGAAYIANANYAGWMYSTADALRWTGGQG